MRRLAALFLFLAAHGSYDAPADTTVIVAPGYGYGYGYGSSYYVDPDRIQRFDDRVFNLSPSSDPGISRRGRFFGRDSQYNTAQREAWEAKCAPLKEVSMKRFRECFDEEKRKMLVEVQQGYDEVQARRRPPRRR